MYLFNGPDKVKTVESFPQNSKTYVYVSLNDYDKIKFQHHSTIWFCAQQIQSIKFQSWDTAAQFS